MITDNIQTGVPNGNAFKTQGINQRTQLVKPNQVNNIGRSMPQQQNIAPQAPQFNPVQPKPAPAPEQNMMPVEQAPSSGPMPASAPAPAPMSEPEIMPVVQDMGGGLGDMPMAAQSNLDNARSAIRKMTDEDIVALLDEIANGSLRGIGSNK